MLSNDEYTNKLKNHISKSLSVLNQSGIKDDRIRWEHIKFEIKQFSITFFKKLSKSLNAEREILERELNDSEKSGSSYFDNEDYLACKTKLDKIYDKKAEGLRIRSKCDWYEKGEKSTKFFLNLEKRHAIQNQVKSLVVNDEVVKEQTDINKNLYAFYQKLFSKNNDISRQKVLQFLQDKNLPKLNDDQCALCEKDITEEEVKHELNKMEINKSPGNDGLTKEFYEAFWDHVKVPLLLSFKMAFLKKELSTSQKQAVIKLIEKKDRDKRFIKNWRPISLLNVNVKLISKVLSNRIKNLLPNLISNN